ncbi:MAG: alpha/beta hydrolase [Candidatus Competibacteraceae bacterium]|nr:alpha/beta hydrolase [Candidatus Competibacteraceae bacterium]
MSDWTLITLTGALSILLVSWILIQIFLKGPNLRTYDQPLPDSRIGSWSHASPEHQEVLRLLEQAQAEIRAAPRKEWLPTVRKVMGRGFIDPPLLASHLGYQVRAVDAGGVPGEWVLAPDADPDRRLLYLHGGSFISGCPQGHRIITTQLARMTGASVLALDYRLMPEHTRRDLLADCQTGYRWILDHSPTGAASARELFVAGDSAGGGLTLMLIAWARDAGLRAADGAIALSPGVDMTLSSPTLKSNIQSDWMLGPSLGKFMKIPFSMRLFIFWVINRMKPPNPLISPIFGDLSGLPPVLVQVSEAEMMLGDARRYVNKARAAGTWAELETWPDLVHVWHLFEPILPEAREALERIGQFVARCSTK